MSVWKAPRFLIDRAEAPVYTERAVPFLLLLLALACGSICVPAALAADVGTAPQVGSFGKSWPNPAGSLGTLTIQNAVHDATGTLYVVEVHRISKFDRDGN